MIFTIKNYDGNYFKTVAEFSRSRPNLTIVETRVPDGREDELLIEAKMTGEELANFEKKLSTGAVQFQYFKKNGILRDACGTRMRELMSTEDYELLQQALIQPKAKFLIPYYDFQKKELRQFHISRFMKTIESVPLSPSETGKVRNLVQLGKFSSFDSLPKPSMLDILDQNGDLPAEVTDQNTDGIEDSSTFQSIFDILKREFAEVDTTKLIGIAREIAELKA